MSKSTDEIDTDDSPSGSRQEPLVMPLVFGIEQEDRLIECRCLHCGVREWRTTRGLNWCELTGKTYYLLSPEREEAA